MTDFILVDTSIWIDHLHRAEDALAGLLRRRRALLHPMVLGEIALGSLARRDRTLAELAALPMATMSSHEDVMTLIERCELASSGVGFVDAHLLASSLATPSGRLWTGDKRLRRVAERLSIAADLA